jgi:hypothetical protein
LEILLGKHDIYRELLMISLFSIDDTDT